MLTRLNLLRIFLAYSAIGWGICVVAIFAPSELALGWLGDLGGLDIRPLQTDPLFDYWLRMAAGAFTLIGAGFLMLAMYPTKYAVMLPFAGLFMLLEGIILLVHGLRLDLAPTPFYGDVGFSITGGIGILLTMKAAREPG